MIYGRPPHAIVKKLRMFRTLIGGTKIDARVSGKEMRPSTGPERPVGDF
jgi:hypothetical protein